MVKRGGMLATLPKVNAHQTGRNVSWQCDSKEDA